MGGKYACQISCTLNGVNQKFLLDTVLTQTINTGSNLSSHPIAQGDMISDHMYRRQSTMSISGTYGLNSGTTLILGAGTNKMAVFETVFEEIKNKGVVCEILRIAKDVSSESRFLKRTNMVLTDIEWTENINTVDFNFTFKQIITSDAATNASYYSSSIQQNLGNFDTTDEFLPSYNVQSLINVVNNSINYSAVCSKMNDQIAIINSNTQTLSRKIKQLGAKGLQGIGVSKEVASLISKASASYQLNDCDYLFSQGFIDQIHTETLLKKFSAIEVIDNSEIIRHCNYLYDIYNKVNDLSEGTSCYQLGVSGEQICTILIDNVYYEFSFTRNNTSNSYYVSVRNTNSDNKEYTIASNLCKASPTNFNDCNISNMLFKTVGHYVFLLKLRDGKESDLTNYFILVCKKNPESFCSELNELINNEVQEFSTYDLSVSATNGTYSPFTWRTPSSVQLTFTAGSGYRLPNTAEEISSNINVTNNSNFVFNGSTGIMNIDLKLGLTQVTLTCIAEGE